MGRTPGTTRHSAAATRLPTFRAPSTPVRRPAVLPGTSHANTIPEPLRSPPSAPRHPRRHRRTAQDTPSERSPHHRGHEPPPGAQRMSGLQQNHTPGYNKERPQPPSVLRPRMGQCPTRPTRHPRPGQRRRVVPLRRSHHQSGPHGRHRHVHDSTAHKHEPPPHHLPPSRLEIRDRGPRPRPTVTRNRTGQMWARPTRLRRPQYGADPNSRHAAHPQSRGIVRHSRRHRTNQERHSHNPAHRGRRPQRPRMPSPRPPVPVRTVLPTSQRHPALHRKTP